MCGFRNLIARIFLVRREARGAAPSQIRIWVASALDLKDQIARLQPRRPEMGTFKILNDWFIHALTEICIFKILSRTV